MGQSSLCKITGEKACRHQQKASMGQKDQGTTQGGTLLMAGNRAGIWGSQDRSPKAIPLPKDHNLHPTQGRARHPGV